MEERRDELMEQCSKLLQPWFDISQLKDDGDETEFKAKVYFSDHNKQTSNTDLKTLVNRYCRTELFSKSLDFQK